MQKPPDVPEPEAQRRNGEASSDAYDDDLIEQFKKYLAQILRVGRMRKRPSRDPHDKRNETDGSD
jgi:hypothetical protein